MTEAIGHNGHREQLERFLANIFEQDDALLSLKGEYMAACKGPRGRIKDILAQVREADINMNAFRELLQTQREDRKRQARIEAMEADDRDAYEILEEALGEFGDTELGQAALNRHKMRQDDETLNTL